MVIDLSFQCPSSRISSVRDLQRCWLMQEMWVPLCSRNLGVSCNAIQNDTTCRQMQDLLSTAHGPDFELVEAVRAELGKICYLQG